MLNLKPPRHTPTLRQAADQRVGTGRQQSGLGKRIGIFGKVGVWQEAAMSRETLVILHIPDHAWRAGREIGLVQLMIRAPSSSSSPSACARSAAANACSGPGSATTGPHTGRRCCQRQAENEDSAQQRQGESAFRVTMILKKG